MANIHYFTDETKIEENAKNQILSLSLKKGVEDIAIFPDIHYCSEKGIPVGLAFSSETHIFPLVTGRDMGCGVSYLKIPKKYVLKPFNKEHYNSLNEESKNYTDEGLGGGNHFLSLEEDENNWYIICHTGTRNLGISMYQNNYKLLQDNGYTDSIEISKLLELQLNWFEEYNKVLVYGQKRRKEFCYKLMWSLMKNGYVDSSSTSKPVGDYKVSYLEILKQVALYDFEYDDSIHNHITKETFVSFENDEVEGYKKVEKIFYIHRKGATELKENQIVVVPLSMTRGSLLVKSKKVEDDNLNSCSHGAGRKLSRTDCLKFWNASLKKKDREQFKKDFPELLDNNGKFSNGYIQEFDFAYKDTKQILKEQDFLKKITITKPIFTIKFTEI